MDFLRREYTRRPAWMNLVFLFCIWMTFFYLPWDIFIKPLARDQEVWFGLIFTGWAAKVGAVAHWMVYASGAWGFYQMRRWMHPWAVVYVLQVALSFTLFPILNNLGGGLWGLIPATAFIVLAVLLWRARPRFTAAVGVGSGAQDGGDVDEAQEESNLVEDHSEEDGAQNSSDET